MNVFEIDIRLEKEIWPMHNDMPGVRFKGGSSQTTNNNYRPLTADELRMQKASADYAELIQPSAYNLFQRSMGMLGQPGTDTTVNPNYNTLYGAQTGATGRNIATANDIAAGRLPQSFADNRNAQARQYAQESVGNLLGALNSRGVIGSSAMNSGLEGINRNLANTFQNSYTQDLGTASNLLGQAQNFANMPIMQANQAQNASYEMPLRLFGAATGQMQPTQQIWQPTLLSNQSNPLSSTTTQKSGSNWGGLFGNILGIGLGNSGFGSNW